MIFYVDLCYSNLNVDYKAMKAGGVALVYIRLGQAGLGVDKMNYIHRTGLASQGLPFGSFFFYDYKHYTPVENAKFCFQYMGQAGLGVAPLALDLEEELKLGWGPLDPVAAVSMANEFYLELAWLTGKNTDGMLFYANPSLIGMMAGRRGIERLTAHPLWIAHWKAAYPDIYPWKSWMLWQNHGDVKMTWASQPVDYGYFNGDAVALDKWLYPDPATPPPALPTRDACINDMLTKAGYKWQA